MSYYAELYVCILLLGDSWVRGVERIELVSHLLRYLSQLLRLITHDKEFRPLRNSKDQDP